MKIYLDICLDDDRFRNYIVQSAEVFDAEESDDVGDVPKYRQDCDYSGN